MALSKAFGGAQRDDRGDIERDPRGDHEVRGKAKGDAPRLELKPPAHWYRPRIYPERTLTPDGAQYGPGLPGSNQADRNTANGNVRDERMRQLDARIRGEANQIREAFARAHARGRAKGDFGRER